MSYARTYQPVIRSGNGKWGTSVAMSSGECSTLASIHILINPCNAEICAENKFQDVPRPHFSRPFWDDDLYFTQSFAADIVLEVRENEKFIFGAKVKTVEILDDDRTLLHEGKPWFHHDWPLLLEVNSNNFAAGFSFQHLAGISRLPNVLPCAGRKKVRHARVKASQ